MPDIALAGGLEIEVGYSLSAPPEHIYLYFRHIPYLVYAVIVRWQPVTSMLSVRRWVSAHLHYGDCPKPVHGPVMAYDYDSLIILARLGKGGLW